MKIRVFQTMINTFFAVLIFFPFIGCEKVDVPKGTPKCIKKEIKENKDRESLASVYAYEWNGETVYYFDYQDYPGSYLLDEECNALCAGGYVSSWQSAPCKDFFNERTNEKLIWQK